MPPVSVMIKPASSACNLACEYCFYHSLADARERGFRGIMTEETFSVIAQKALEHADGADVFLSFQGGEPLLAGKKFFVSAFESIEKFNKKHSRVFIGVQTNGTLIDGEWCDIFAAERVLVGLSLDGDEKANKFRVFQGGQPTFDKISAAAEMLSARGAEFNILTVVTAPVAERIEEIYSFFKKRGFRYLQYIPCLKPIGGGEEEYFLDGEAYGDFLIKAFNLYARDYFADDYVSVRIFDNFVRLAGGRRAEQCGMNGHCTHQFVVESDGEVYPCDFFCADGYSLGNILTSDFRELERSKRAEAFIKESLVKKNECKECAYYALCAGGCKRERMSLDVCAAYKKFLSYALPVLRRMG